MPMAQFPTKERHFMSVIWKEEEFEVIYMYSSHPDQVSYYPKHREASIC